MRMCECDMSQKKTLTVQRLEDTTVCTQALKRNKNRTYTMFLLNVLDVYTWFYTVVMQLQF